MSEVSVENHGGLRCLRCKKRGLVRTGKEPYRFECSDCKQQYFAVMILQPVETPIDQALLEASSVERGPGTE